MTFIIHTEFIIHTKKLFF